MTFSDRKKVNRRLQLVRGKLQEASSAFGAAFDVVRELWCGMYPYEEVLEQVKIIRRACVDANLMAGSIEEFLKGKSKADAPGSVTPHK